MWVKEWVSEWERMYVEGKIIIFLCVCVQQAREKDEKKIESIFLRLYINMCTHKKGIFLSRVMQFSLSYSFTLSEPIISLWLALASEYEMKIYKNYEIYIFFLTALAHILFISHILRLLHVRRVIFFSPFLSSLLYIFLLFFFIFYR